MFPLLGGNSGEPPYHTLREALDAGTVEVTEISEGGSVPRLALANRGDKPVLIVDGEELVGARQNRILNITILAPAGKTTVLPVSCVEQGRWGYRSRTFEDYGRVLFHKAQAAKAEHLSASRMRCGSSDSDQGEVWSHIAAKMETMSVRSASHAMEDIYTSHAPRLEAYAKTITPVAGQAGAIFAINGQIEDIEAFAYTNTLSRLLVKFVRGYAIDTLENSNSPAVGLGEDLRFQSKTLSGGALAADGVLLHLCVFRLAQASSRPTDDGGTIRRRSSGRNRPTG